MTGQRPVLNTYWLQQQLVQEHISLTNPHLSLSEALTSTEALPGDRDKHHTQTKPAAFGTRRSAAKERGLSPARRDSS